MASGTGREDKAARHKEWGGERNNEEGRKGGGALFHHFGGEESAARPATGPRHYECSVLEDGHPEREEDDGVRQGEEQRDGEGDLCRSDWNVECFIHHTSAHHVVEVEQIDSDGNRREEDCRHPASQDLPAEKHALV